MMKALKSTKRIALIRSVAIGLLMGFSICIGPILFAWTIFESFNDGWDLQTVENHLHVSIPADAHDFHYSSGSNRYVHVDLSFKAPPASVLDFAKHFCDGVLHQGYDPFNAFDLAEPVPNSVEIQIIEAYYTYSYYSYSPRAVQTEAGNYCDLPQKGQFWLLVDETDPALYTLKFKHVLDRFAHDNDVKPIANFPLIVRGLMSEQDGSYSAYMKLCFDLDPAAVHESVKWNALIGADIGVAIDGRMMTGAYVTNEIRLSRTDGKTNFSDPNSDLFKYCLFVRQGGWHTVTIHLPSTFTGNHTYTWRFHEEYSDRCDESYIDNDCY